MSRLRTVTALASLAVAGALATVPAGADDAYTTNCPPPEDVVTGTTWTWHRIAPGVRLQEGQHRDSTGRVRMHVLRVDVTDPHISFGPVMRRVAMRSRLSAMARDERRLVATTNGGYFDYRTDAPLSTVIENGRPVVAGSTPAWVVGFGPTGAMQAAKIGLAGTVTSGLTTHSLTGINAAHPVAGITSYTPKWGSARVPTPRTYSTARYVRDGLVASGSHRFTKAPKRGVLLVAKGYAAKSWLRSLHIGDPVLVRPTWSAEAPTAPFTLGFGAGSQIVAPGGEARLGLSCRRSYKQPARTGIGFTADGRTMLLVVVDDKKRTPLHGVDSIQLGRIMADLGADQAYLLDGGGSTEMLARIPGHGLSLRNHLSDGVERPIPVGVGIFRR